MIMTNWILIIHIILFVIIMPIGIYINRKLYINIKNEKRRENGKVIQQIIKTYSIAQPILSVITYILITPKESFEIFEIFYS